MRRTLSAVLFAAAASAAGCDSPFGSGTPELSVSARLGTLTLVNHADEPVYYILVERQAYPAVSWVPCARPESCPGIAPGASVRLPYDRIAGYDPGDDEAMVITYRLEPGPDGTYLTTDSQTRTVRLR